MGTKLETVKQIFFLNAANLPSSPSLKLRCTLPDWWFPIARPGARGRWRRAHRSAQRPESGLDPGGRGPGGAVRWGPTPQGHRPSPHMLRTAPPGLAGTRAPRAAGYNGGGAAKQHTVKESIVTSQIILRSYCSTNSSVFPE